MVELAWHILESKATKFAPEKFKDEYEKALRKLVQRKAKGHAIEAPAAPERPSNVINLIDALRESIKGDSGSRRAAPRRGARKHKRGDERQLRLERLVFASAAPETRGRVQHHRQRGAKRRVVVPLGTTCTA